MLIKCDQIVTIKHRKMSFYAEISAVMTITKLNEYNLFEPFYFYCRLV